ncbi:MAG: photosystem I reaction center subunit II [Cyanobacteriota bacterium]|nr:photosystem I reaction center subunit II [Cyanobacteriota bacterium]
MAEALKEGDPRLGASVPLFGGTTGGLLGAADTEEKYVITWTGKAGQVFEMPTSGAAVMVEGKNMLTLARKEQCLALGAQLISSFKIKDYQIFRVKAGGEPVLVHPKDGVFPEKMNAGRETVGKVDRSIGKNPDPATYKFTGKRAWN